MATNEQSESHRSISVATVTPVYRGAAYLEQLVAELNDARERWIQSAAPFRLEESIFVDDSSTDGSAEVLSQISSRYPWVRVVTLSRNFGQHPATVAGILHSSADWIFTLDEDLQHHPRDCERLLREVGGKTPVDIVYAKPKSAVHASWVRDLGSRYSKWLVARLTDNEMVEHFNSFRLLRGSVARASASLCSADTYFDVALSWFSNRFASIELDLHDQRFVVTGQSGYSVKRLIRHFKRMILSSRSSFLRVGAGLGVVAMLISGMASVWVVAKKVSNPESIQVQGWSSLFVAILFFGGLSILLIGIVLEYLTAISMQMQGKPAFYSVDRSQDWRIAEFFSP